MQCIMCLIHQLINLYLMYHTKYIHIKCLQEERTHIFMKNIMMMYQDTVIQEKVSMIISQLGIHQLP